MRILPAFGLALLACGAADRRQSAAADASPSASTSGSRRAGLDAIVLRLPRLGGAAHAYLYPHLDSVIWTSARTVPAVDHMLAFDDESGSLAFMDTKGAPGRLDLHLGTVSVVTRTKLSDVASADGYAIYGIGAKGDVIRLIPTGSWTFKPPTPASELIPMPDGTLLVVADRDSGAVVWRLRPPDVRISDSARISGAREAFASPIGDRLYIVQGAAVGGLRSRDVVPFRPVKFDGPVRAVALTPSGDRLFVALDSVPQIVVFDRYAERVTATITLPGPAVELRMDSLGRTVLARAASGDSVAVIGVGTEQLVGVVRSAWRPDLPFVAPDGALALASGDDVLFVDGTTLRTRVTIAGGATDLWRVVSWNGFRPRAAGLDVPVTFAEAMDSDTIAIPDSGPAAATAGMPPLSSASTTPISGPARSAPAASPGAGTPATALATGSAAPTPPAPVRVGFTVSFATFGTEDKARTLASQIRVGAQQARVLVSQSGGSTVYRVVLGPFPSRAEADRVGRGANHEYWVFEGTP